MAQWYEDIEQYTESIALPVQLPYDKLSLVRVYASGKTQPGWGAKEFVDNYANNAFDPGRALWFFEKYKSAFGIVMRSVPCICVDIDGKNGGIEIARNMQLPRTLAEFSRSENGFHLFYEVPGTEWNPLRGYDEFPDIIGLVPGVDIKGTGIVFHYPNQRWNNRELALAPAKLMELIGRARDTKRLTRQMAFGVSTMDPDELVLVHDSLLSDLAGTFEVGKRNSKLFAIGAQLYGAQYPHWDTAIYDRGVQIGLELEEIADIIRNIESYS